MIRIIALTEAGHHLADRLQGLINSGLQEPSEVWFKPTPFTELVQNAFKAGDRLIFICATGIVMRTLAPVLQSKLQDPPVLVLDEQGEFVIPLLSGHEGGANDLAKTVADLLDGQLVMTTAKPYLKPIYTVGMGCERDCPIEYLSQVLELCLAKANLAIDDISSINSIDIKADETMLIALAKQHNKAFNTFSASELSAVEDQLSTKSDYIFNTVGVYGVAESAALYAAQMQVNDTAELLVEKHKNAKATCAIARAYPPAPSQNA